MAVELIERLVVRSGNSVFAVGTIAVAVVAIFDTLDIRARTIVLPIRILDPAEAIEAAVDVARIWVVAASGSPERVLQV